MADYKQIFIQGVATVYKTLASLTRPIILELPPGAYDPVTDTSAPGTQTVPINGFIYHEENKQAQSSGYSETLLLQNSDVVAAGLANRIDQAAKAIVDGVIYEVDYVGYDPVAATVKFYARRG